MDREPSESGRSGRTTVYASAFLDWIEQPIGEVEPTVAPTVEPTVEPKVADTIAAHPSETHKTMAKSATKKPAAKPVPKAQAKTAAAAAAPAARPLPPVGTAVITVEIDDFDDESDQLPTSKPRAAKVRTPKTRPVDARPWWRNRALQAAASAVVVGVVVAFIYHLGGGSSVPGINGQPTNQPSQAAAQIDQTKVADLMKKISANPKDAASYQALGDIYFQAGQYQTASEWDQKVLGIDPNNVTGLLSDGAAQFNLGNADKAQTDWQKVIALNPKQAEAYYDLGFLYLSKNPPDMTKVKAMWQKVVEIDPTSDVAKTVQQHLKSLSSSAPSSSAPAGK